MFVLLLLNVKLNLLKEKRLLHISKINMSSLDTEWAAFLQQHNDTTSNFGLNLNGTLETGNTNPPLEKLLPVPETIVNSQEENKTICDEELYISTKTKVLYLNMPIDIQNIFWNIPITEYWKPQEGVLKKQIKIISNTREEYSEYRQKLEKEKYYVENIIKQIDNPTARKIKYKDERKLTIGLSKKDIMNCRGKIKNAFYNCFAIIVRFKYKEEFREIHVKVFNTGKMEIPGVLNDEILNIIKQKIVDIIQPNVTERVEYIENNETEGNVLINSNFNCGYYVNREKLHSIIRNKYGIEAAFDPCSYPGVKCKFYFNNEVGFDKELQKGHISKEDRDMKMSELNDHMKYTEISFMIFRTGSCLIVGNCSEKVLNFVFNFIKEVLKEEYSVLNVINSDTTVKEKKTKLRKKTIQITSQYMNETILKKKSHVRQ